MPTPSPVLPVNSIRAIVYYESPNSVWSFTLYYEPATAGYFNSQGRIDKAAQAIQIAMLAKLLPCMSDKFSFRGVTAYFHGAGDVLWEGTKYGSNAGTYSTTSTNDQALPDESCVMIRKLTGRGGPEDRGRIYLSTVCEDQQTAGQLTVAAAEVYKDFANTIPADVSVTDADEVSVILHARHWNRKDNVLRPIVSGKAVTTLVSRRDRRRPRVLLPTN